VVLKGNALCRRLQGNGWDAGDEGVSRPDGISVMAETPHRSKTACAGVERGRADLITHAGVIKSAPGAGRAASVSEEPTGVPSSPSLHP
jgi:hypothetical protein